MDTLSTCPGFVKGSAFIVHFTITYQEMGWLSLNFYCESYLLGRSELSILFDRL